MGELQIKPINKSNKNTFTRHLLDDIQTLDQMLEDGAIESGIHRIGAEQEFCIVDKQFMPSMHAPELLEKIRDDHFTTELAKWNLEINMDPLNLKSGCFTLMESKLLGFLNKAKEQSKDKNESIVLTGILPTIKKSDLSFNSMTPLPRYKILSDIMRANRGEDFSLHIQGVDELNIQHDSILFEACNTSFQMHLQVDPEKFADHYNWAQMISGPVLAACTNSPLLMGKELWHETRIAVFRQSIDLRSTSHLMQEKQPRVSFGTRWIESSITEIFKEDIARFALLVGTDIESFSSEEYSNGIMPKLRALSLHNGTVYKWNRPCYGVNNNIAHIRIENRYIPAGPTVKDEISNMVFWTGLMLAIPEEYKGKWMDVMPFGDVRGNFIQAARNGLSSQFLWGDDRFSATDLILHKLLPMASKALESQGIPKPEFMPYLDVVRKRVSLGRTGSRWIIRSIRHLNKHRYQYESNIAITAQMQKYAYANIPVCDWELANEDILDELSGLFFSVDSVMSIDLITVNVDDLISFVDKVMKWRKIRHMPVEDSNGKIVGVVSHSVMESYRNNRSNYDREALIKEIMIQEIKWIAPEAKLENAIKIMKITSIGCLPVVKDDKLVGILTDTDIRNVIRKMKLE